MSKKDKNYEDYQFSGQHPDEKVEMVFRQHPVVMRRRLIAVLVLITLGAVPLSFWPLEAWPWWVLLGGFVLGILVFGHRLIGWFYSLFIITDERLIQIAQKGFFNRKVVDISHSKIQNVSYQVKGLQASLLGYGTLDIQTYVGNISLPFVHRPQNVHQLMVTQMRGTKGGQPAINSINGAGG